MSDPTKESTVSAPATSVHTYHCICTHLILGTTTPLSSLSTRTSDKSLILPLQNHGTIIQGTMLDAKPTVIRREDGFEKRYMHRCARCEIVVGYALDKSQWEESRNETGRRDGVVFLLPGGLVGTEDMLSGKDMKREIGLVEAKG